MYENVPLKHADSIRLLLIHAGQQQDVLRCILTPARLDLHARASYGAISYMWGSRDQIQSVIVNDEVLFVHLNLYQFLLRLRQPDRDVTVWADAICINQNDPAERGHQVQLMSRIYSQADRTLVWLGESMPDLESLIFSHNGSGLDNASNVIKNRRAENALWELVSHEYWERTWILQEVILAKSVTVYVGRQDIEWISLLDMFFKVVPIYTQVQIDTQFPGRTYTFSKLGRMLEESRFMLLNKERNLGEGQQRNFPDLLRDHQHSKCQNRQDRVFGLVGLITDVNDPLYPLSLSEKAQAIFDYTLPLEVLRDRLRELYGSRNYKLALALRHALIL